MRIDRRGTQGAPERAEGGFILVIALMLTMLVALLGATFLAYIPYELQRTAQATGRDVALEAADAGLQDVIRHLIQDVEWDGYDNPNDPVLLSDPQTGQDVAAYVLNIHTGVDSLDQNLSPREVLQGIPLGYDADGMKRIGIISTGYKLDRIGNIRMRDGSPDPDYARRLFALVVTVSPSDYVLYTGGDLTLVNGGVWNGKIHSNALLSVNNYSPVPGLNDTIRLNATASSVDIPSFGGSIYPYTGPSDGRIVSTASPSFMCTAVLPMPYIDLSDEGPFMQATGGDPDSGYYGGGVQRFDRWSENHAYGLWLGELSESALWAQSFIQSTGPNPEDTLRVIEREVGSGTWQRWWVRREGAESTITLTALDTLYTPLSERYAYQAVPQNYRTANAAEEGGVIFIDDGVAVVGDIMVDGRLSICSGTETISDWQGKILINGDIKYADVDYNTEPPVRPPETKERPCGLGLFATDDIVIADPRYEYLGIPGAPDTLVMSAQIVSENGVFRGQYIHLPEWISSWDRKFTLVGGIASYETPELSRAYGRRSYNYDENLTRVKLPALPRIVYLYPGSWRVLPVT